MLAIATAALPAAPALAQDCPADAVVVALARDGETPQASRAFERATLAGLLAARQAQWAAEEARATELMRGTAAAEASAVFTAVQAGIPEFGGWAYGWVSNYVFSYEVVAQAARRTIADGVGFATALQDMIGVIIHREFEERVLRRVHFTDRFDIAQARLDQLTGDEARRALLREARAWSDAALPCEPSSAPTAVLDLRSQPPALPPHADPMRRADPSDDVSGTFALRAIRPFGARTAILTIRLFEAGSILTSPGWIGVNPSGPVGSAVSLALGASIIWGADYLLNSADASLNRAGLEVALSRGVMAAEGSASETLAENATNLWRRNTGEYLLSLQKLQSYTKTLQ